MDNGFSSPSTDEPLTGNPRVHEEGRHNYERNNKSSDWFVHSGEIIDSRPESRLRSDAARANALKNRGSMQNELNQHNTSSSHYENAEAETPEYANIVTREDINNHIENHSNSEVTSKLASKPEKSAEIGEQNGREQSSSSVSVSNGSSSLTSPDSEQHPAKPPRSLLIEKNNTGKKKGAESVVKSNGNKTPRESKQGRLHQESTGSGWDQTPPHQRLRADGEDIARKYKTDSVTEIFLHKNTPPEVKEPKVVRTPEPITYTPRKPPTPRVRPEGLQNLQKAMNHSEMSAIMHGRPAESAPPQPSSGRKVLPHMQRSELW